LPARPVYYSFSRLIISVRQITYHLSVLSKPAHARFQVVSLKQFLFARSFLHFITICFTSFSWSFESIDSIKHFFCSVTLFLLQIDWFSFAFQYHSRIACSVFFRWNIFIVIQVFTSALRFHLPLIVFLRSFFVPYPLFLLLFFSGIFPFNQEVFYPTASFPFQHNFSKLIKLIQTFFSPHQSLYYIFPYYHPTKFKVVWFSS
jgi:hypothetical protein